MPNVVDWAFYQARLRVLRQHYTARELSEAFKLAPSTEGKTLRRWQTGERHPGPKNRNRINRLYRDLERNAGYYKDPAATLEHAEDQVRIAQTFIASVMRDTPARSRNATLYEMILDALDELDATGRPLWTWDPYIGRQPPAANIRHFAQLDFAYAGSFRWNNATEILWLLAVEAHLADLETFEKSIAQILQSGGKVKNIRSPAIRNLLVLLQEEAQQRVLAIRKRQAQGRRRR